METLILNNSEKINEFISIFDYYGVDINLRPCCFVNLDNLIKSFLFNSNFFNILNLFFSLGWI